MLVTYVVVKRNGVYRLFFCHIESFRLTCTGYLDLLYITEDTYIYIYTLVYFWNWQKCIVHKLKVFAHIHCNTHCTCSLEANKHVEDGESWNGCQYIDLCIYIYYVSRSHKHTNSDYSSIPSHICVRSFQINT